MKKRSKIPSGKKKNKCMERKTCDNDGKEHTGKRNVFYYRLWLKKTCIMYEFVGVCVIIKRRVFSKLRVIDHR